MQSTVILTDRDVELLQCIAKGYNNMAIAETLHKSKNTIKNDLNRLFNKLYVENRVQALLWAIRAGVVQVGEQ